MAKADFAAVSRELDALESEIEPLRVSVDEGEDVFTKAPTARETAYHHLAAALGHAIGSARSLIDEADWDEPEDDLDAIEILVEEDVVPGRIGSDIIDLAEFATQDGGEEPWEGDGLYDRMTQGVETLSEYLEYVHLFLKEWAD